SDALGRFRSRAPEATPERDVPLSPHWPHSAETTTDNAAVDSAIERILSGGVPGVVAAQAIPDVTGQGRMWLVELENGARTAIRVRADETLDGTWLYLPSLRADNSVVTQTAPIE